MLPDAQLDNKNETKSNNCIKEELYKTFADFKQINWNECWEGFLLRYLFGLTNSLYFSNQSLYIRNKFQISQKHVGYIISFLSTGGVIAGFMLGYIKNKFYKNDYNCFGRLLHGFIAFSICFLGLGIASSLPVFLMFLIPYAMASSILRNVTMELIIAKSNDSEKGLMSGASNSVMSVARSISPLISALSMEVMSDVSVMFTAFVPSFTGMVLCVYLKQKSRSREHSD